MEGQKAFKNRNMGEFVTLNRKLMFVTKAQLSDAITKIPEDKFIDIEAVIEEIQLFLKIENGLRDMEEGRVISEEELDKAMEEW